MCRQCIKQLRPDRGKVCLAAGAYVINFKGCASCGKIDGLPMSTCHDGSAIGPMRNRLPKKNFKAEAGKKISTNNSSTSVINSDCEGTDTSEDSSENEEETTYAHICFHCGHFICEHSYVHSQNIHDRVDMMDCLLCGRGYWRRESLQTLFQARNKGFQISNVDKFAVGSRENSRSNKKDDKVGMESVDQRVSDYIKQHILNIDSVNLNDENVQESDTQSDSSGQWSE